MRTRRRIGTARLLLRRLTVVGGAVGLTLAFFLVLPLMQSLQRPPGADLIVRAVDTTALPPPPPPPEPEPEDEPEEEEQPPELDDEAPPLDLSQLELALDPGFGAGWMGGDFAIDLGSIATRRDDVDALLSLTDLDQRPRAVYQPSPVVDAQLRRKAPGTVYVLFIVDVSGRVEDPTVQSSTDPVFERPALAAVSQWKFEPGKHNGEAVRFRMRVPITFPEG